MQYDLVFEGGGAKGFAFVGAYEEFVRRGHTHGRLLGASAGAITSALLAAGYSSDELLAALSEQKDGQPVFATFMGQPAAFTPEEIRASHIRAFLRNVDMKFIPNFIEDRMEDLLAKVLAENASARHLFSFVERGGWYAADPFVLWLEQRLDSGTWNGAQRQFSKLTLAQFYEATKSELSVVASDTTDHRLLVLNHTTAPDCPVVWAVRMSMGFPLLWEEVVWKQEWGQYLGRNVTGHVIVDGGMLSNFPIELFISDEPQVTEVMGPKQDVPVLGMLIDESLPVYTSTRGILVDVNVKPTEMATVQRAMRLIDTMTGAHDKMVLDAFEYLVVRLPAQGYGTTEFVMPEERLNALLDAGRSAVAAYFDNPPAPPPLTRGLDDPAQASADHIASRILR